MSKLVKVRIIAQTETMQPGKEVYMSKKDSEKYVKRGLAEYVEEPAKAKKTSKKKAGKKKTTVTTTTLITKEEDKNEFLYKNKQGKYFANVDALARHLIIKYNFKTIYHKKGDELFVFDGKIYNSDKGREVVKTEVESKLNKYARNQVVNEVFEKIKRLTAFERTEFDNITKDIIPLKNGLYNLKTRKLNSFIPSFPFRYYIPVDYNPKKDCPKFKKFLSEALYEQDIPLAQEMFGFSLYREYFIKKAFILNGEGDTGKTVLLNTLTEFIGEKNTSGVALQRIAYEDKFSISSMYNKHVNIYDDLRSKDLADGGGFKVATGGGWMTGEYKFGDSFQFKSYAKQIFACNKIPPIKDLDDDAYFGRWLVLPFDNPVPEKKQDKFLLKKITTEDELSGILNWALEGLYRLLKNGRFSYEYSLEQVKGMMNRSGNPLYSFAEDCLIEKEGGRISKEQMFEIYTVWAKKNNLTRLSKTQLGRSLESVVPYIIAKNDAERFWANVSINLETKKVDLDTLDVFKKIMSNNSKSDSDSNKNNNNMIFLEVSNPSKNSIAQEDTLDTYSEKDEDYEYD